MRPSGPPRRLPLHAADHIASCAASARAPWPDDGRPARCRRWRRWQGRRPEPRRQEVGPPSRTPRTTTIAHLMCPQIQEGGRNRQARGETSAEQGRRRARLHRPPPRRGCLRALPGVRRVPGSISEQVRKERRPGWRPRTWRTALRAPGAGGGPPSGLHARPRRRARERRSWPRWPHVRRPAVRPALLRRPSSAPSPSPQSTTAGATKPWSRRLWTGTLIAYARATRAGRRCLPTTYWPDFGSTASTPASTAPCCRCTTTSPRPGTADPRQTFTVGITQDADGRRGGGGGGSAPRRAGERRARPSAQGSADRLQAQRSRRHPDAGRAAREDLHPRRPGARHRRGLAALPLVEASKMPA